MKYKIALQRSDEGYSASVPGLPGCWSQGPRKPKLSPTSETPPGSNLAVRDELLEHAVVREVEVA